MNKDETKIVRSNLVLIIVSLVIAKTVKERADNPMEEVIIEKGKRLVK
jgi:hypothetical protein